MLTGARSGARTVEVVIGRVFDDRYEVVRKLGSGGMADVYLANDRLLGRQVALKVLSARYAHDEQFVERFRREASSAAGLNHPNIVQIYDRGEAEGTYYIAMEYLEGRSLKEIIVKYAPLSPDLVVSIAVQILEALRFAHRRDVIHRDIKPQNIIVDNDGRVKVTDFGIARAGSASTMTEAGSILGTAHYLSPEQAQGQPVEAASDLYSLGVVMYEMATGKLPFDGDNPVGIAMQHVHEAPVLPPSLAPELPENLEPVILRALAKSPANRYRSADAFLDDLRRVEQGLEVAPSPELGDQPTQLLGAAALGSTTVMQRTQVRPVEGTVPVEPWPAAELVPAPPRRSRWWLWLLAVLFVLLLAGGAYALFSMDSPDTGPDLVAVPTLVGLSEEVARERATSAGFVLQVAGEEPSTQYAAGQVTRQSPAPDTDLASGETIQVWLAAGQEQVEVPDVVGQTRERAGSILGQAGFTVMPRTEESGSPEGEVIRQDPAGGAQALRGSQVTIWVSSGPPKPTTIAVPDVVGMKRDRAKQTLEAAGFVVTAQRVDSDRPADEVVEQSPAAGTQRPADSTVLLSVSNGPQTVVVPNLMGMSAAEARSTLEAAGLKVQEVGRPNADVPPGDVFDQDPQPDQEVRKGTTVTIVVAQPEPTTTTTPTPPSS